MLESHGVPEPPGGGGNWGWIGWVFAGIVATIQALVHRRRIRQLQGGDVESSEALDRLSNLEEKNRLHEGNYIRLAGVVENLKQDMVTKDDLRDFERRLIRNLHRT